MAILRKVRVLVGRARTATLHFGRLRRRWTKWTRRLKDPARRAATSWCRDHSTDLDDFALSVAPELWASARETKRRIGSMRKDRLRALDLHGSRPQDIGGGPGNLALLNWVVRVLEPKTVIETGVASGASSRAILEALEANGRGHLFSSDLAGVIPREHSGLCVDAEFFPRWRLFQEGDRINLPEILREVDSVDLLHYDSAKDAEEMRWVVENVVPRLSNRGVLVLDDIDRHGFMEEYVKSSTKSWFVFGAVGVIGLLEALDGRLPSSPAR